MYNTKFQTENFVKQNKTYGQYLEHVLFVYKQYMEEMENEFSKFSSTYNYLKEKIYVWYSIRRTFIFIIWRWRSFDYSFLCSLANANKKAAWLLVPQTKYSTWWGSWKSGATCISWLIESLIIYQRLFKSIQEEERFFRTFFIMEP